MEFHQFKSIFGYIEAKSQHVCEIQFKYLSIFLFLTNSIQTFLQFSFFNKIQLKSLLNFLFSDKIRFKKIFKLLKLAVFISIKYSFNKKTWVSNRANYQSK